MPDELTDMLRVVREAPAAVVRRRARGCSIGSTGRICWSRCCRARNSARQLDGARPLRTAAPANRRAPARSAACSRGSCRSSARRARWPRSSIWRSVSGSPGRARAIRRRRSCRSAISSTASTAAAKSRAARRRPSSRSAASPRCLHAEFSGVLPSIRLDWAETLSQFDESPSLRRLGSLARWGEIPYIDRYRMQAFADWLFSRINADRAARRIADERRRADVPAARQPTRRSDASSPAGCRGPSPCGRACGCR